MDVSWPADHLHGHSLGKENLDRTPRLQVEVDLKAVPAGSGEIELRRSDAGPDSCVSGQLPARTQLDIAICRLQYKWAYQPQRGGGEPDQRWQGHHRSLEIGSTGGGEDLLQDSREVLMRQISSAEKVMEPGNGRDPVVVASPNQSCCKCEVFVHRDHFGPEDPKCEAKAGGTPAPAEASRDSTSSVLKSHCGKTFDKAVKGVLSHR
jgi:hypothetical protein